MDSNSQQGIDAFNQEFAKYDQVEKLQRYRLSEGEEDHFDDEYVLQTCDISEYLYGGASGKAKFAHELGSSLEDIGFAIITGHGVNNDHYKQARTLITDLFENYSVESRMKFRAQRHGSVNQGYFPIKETTIIHPDLVEGWVFCRRAFDLDNNPNYKWEDYWPEARFEESFRKIVLAHEQLIIPLMQSILQYLKVDINTYNERLTHTNFGFRLNYYPPLSDGEGDTGGRMLGHEDVDLFTILPASEIEGLQALHRGSMKWVRVNAPEGSIVLNTGDYMQRITNNRLPSTTHRVSRPQNASLNNKARISFPMAVYVWEDEILEVLPGLGKPKYPPVRAEAFHTQITSKYYGDDYAKS
ncbi:MAG: isopenicillin N synthase family oxygenase [Flavobacteriales bacterium]|nr:isopenicillin N synthase family oxygenase [Flavobacteriales bacterium]